MSNIAEMEDRLLDELDPHDLEMEVKESQEDIKALSIDTSGASIETLTCLPTNNHGVLAPEFWKYYHRPWTPIFFDYNDPFNDLVKIWWGPRGGGKTGSSVSVSIIDGQMKGIPCISNVPFAWIAKDINGKLYKIESIPFDQERFASGDKTMKFHRLFIDEGNYLTDRLRAVSNKNMAMTDILQQARKFRMCVDFATINWMWLDSRITGSLCDLLIECNDLYFKPYGRKQKIKKGHRIAWDVVDQSGKLSGRVGWKLASTTFNFRSMWHTYNTENFVDPLEARKKLKRFQKVMYDENGMEVNPNDWFAKLGHKIQQLARSQPYWPAEDLWSSLGINDRGLRVRAGHYMRGQLGINKNLDNKGYAIYDLSECA